MKRRILSTLLAVMLTAALALPVMAAECPVTVTLDGVPIQWTDAVPYTDENGRTMVPLRPVAEAMGLEVEWDEETQMAMFLKATEYPNRLEVRLAAFTIGDTESFCIERAVFPNGAEDEYSYTWEMDTVAVQKNDRTYAPLRYLADHFYYGIEWDGASFTVALTSPEDVALYHRAVRTLEYDFLMEFYPGEDTQFYGKEIRNVTLDGAPVAFKQFSQADLDAANAAFGAEYLAFAFAIEQDLPYGTYDITWELYWYDESGEVIEVQKVDAGYTITRFEVFYYER